MIQERESAFKAHETKYVGSRGDEAAKIERETAAQLIEQDARVAKEKDKMIEVGD